MAPSTSFTRQHAPPSDRPLRPSRRWITAAVLATGLLLQASLGAAGPQEDAAGALCTAAKAAADQKLSTVQEQTTTAKTAACLRYLITYLGTGAPRKQVHPATLNVPSLIDVNGDSKPDLIVSIQVTGDGVTMAAKRLPSAPAQLAIKLEAVAPLPTNPGREAAFGYDATGSNAPASFVVTIHRTVDPAKPGQPDRYALDVSEYTPAESGQGLELEASLYKPVSTDDWTRTDPISATLAFAPFPPAGTSVQFSPDAKAIAIDSPVSTLVDATATVVSGSSTKRMSLHIDKLPARGSAPHSLGVSLDDLIDGRRQVSYTAASTISTLRVKTTGLSMGPLGTPEFTAEINGLPKTVTAILPSASSSFALSASSTIGRLSVTADNIALGPYRHLYATIDGIPAATPEKPHTIAMPNEAKILDVAMASGTSLGMVDVELTEGSKRLPIASTIDGVAVRLENGNDAVHARVSKLRSLYGVYAVIGDVRAADVRVDSAAARRFEVRIDRQGSSKWEYLYVKLSSLRPNTRVTAGMGPITNHITYTAGDSVRPRLDIDTNMGNRESLHVDVPQMPRTFDACVSFGTFCMRNPDKRVAQRRDAHKKAFFSLDVEASDQMTINVRDCIHRDSGASATCGHESYGKTIWGSITFKSLALDAWIEKVVEDWDFDNALGHLYIDTDNNPVTANLTSDNTNGTDFRVVLNGLKAQDALIYFDRDWTALLAGYGWHRDGSLTCGPSPFLGIRPDIDGWDDPWLNGAGYIC